MPIEQRVYDKDDILIETPPPIRILPNNFTTQRHRVSGHFSLPTGERPDFYMDITASCDDSDRRGSVSLVNPIDGTFIKKAVDNPDQPARLEIRFDDGSQGAVEWHIV